MSAWISKQLNHHAGVIDLSLENSAAGIWCAQPLSKQHRAESRSHSASTVQWDPGIKACPDLANKCIPIRAIDFEIANGATGVGCA